MRRKRMPQRVTAGCLAETCLAHGPAILSQIAFGYFKERSGCRELPITFVASSGGELLGSAMLIHREMDTHPQFTPWLAGVFVALAHRRRGIGSALTEHAIREAAAHGYPTVYLFTPSAQD